MSCNLQMRPPKKDPVVDASLEEVWFVHLAARTLDRPKLDGLRRYGGSSPRPELCDPKLTQIQFS